MILKAVHQLTGLDPLQDQITVIPIETGSHLLIFLLRSLVSTTCTSPLQHEPQRRTRNIMHSAQRFICEHFAQLYLGEELVFLRGCQTVVIGVRTS